MIDKSHCKMTEDDDDWFAEYGEFYRWDDGATDDGEDAGEWEELEGAEREEALIAETSGGLVNRQSRTTRRELTTDNDDSAFELVLSSGENRTSLEIAVCTFQRKLRRIFDLCLHGDCFYVPAATYRS